MQLYLPGQRSTPEEVGEDFIYPTGQTVRKSLESGPGPRTKFFRASIPELDPAHRTGPSA